MKRSLTALILLTILGSAITGAASRPDRERAATYRTMISPIHDLLELLDEDQRKKILLRFDDAERFNWHFVPRDRRGLSLKEMSGPQRATVNRLLGAALSDQGLAKVNNILLIEEVLDEIESAGRPGPSGFRDPERYVLTLFGKPSEKAPWGWRFEGHHLSLNFSSVSGFVVGTPAFYGANPAEVPEGRGDRSGLRTLADEEDLGRKLISALDDEQKSQAIFSATAPREILTGASREVSLEQPVGLAFSSMTTEQQDILRQIVSVYIDNMDTTFATDYWRRVEKKGWEHVHFAWAGGITKGEGHYYRIQGPAFLIEYDNVQNDANHIHSVLRDLENDWGADFLRRHYEQHKHP